jgi:hypothetical protein
MAMPTRLVLPRLATTKTSALTAVAMAFLATACGAGSGKAQSPNAQPASSPGAQCLLDAAAPRQIPGDAPETITVSHIHVRHAELEDPHGATRSREDACLRALEALDKLQDGGDWNTVVEKYSESSKATHGDLGRISREEVRGSFADAAFSLEVNELSYVVETDRGYHVILRTD